MADVTPSFNSWSSITNNNNPQGTATVANGLDDNLREIQGAVVRGLSHKGGDLTAAATVNLGASEGSMHDVLGTSAISSFGVSRAGLWKVLRFRATGSLTHNATSLILPGGSNITTADGDVAVALSLGSGNWQVISYVPAVGVVPVGTLIDFAGTSAPNGYLLCDGSAVSRTTYVALFATIGTTWGSGNGTTTFNIPDFRRRTAVGSGGTGTGTLGNSVGNTGGAETHTLSTSEMPSHSHGGGSHTHTLNSSDSSTSNLTSEHVYEVIAGSVGTVTTSASGQIISAEGGGGSHNNLQPSAVVLKIIKF